MSFDADFRRTIEIEAKYSLHYGASTPED